MERTSQQGTMEGDGRRRLVDLGAALLLAQALATSIEQFMAARRDKLGFDDAYMFLRYAHNIRHSLGFSWNLNGVHTYGPTSLLWSFCVLLLSYLPTDPWTQLLLGSWVCSLATVMAMAWAVRANARSEWLRRPLPTLALVAAPLFASRLFQGDQFNGMETMLATALCAVFFGLCLLWRAGRVSPVVVGAAGVLLFLARPESGLVTVLLPALVGWRPGYPSGLEESDGQARPSLRGFLEMYGVFCAGVLIELALCRLYFGTPVPLSVHMKGGEAYRGYGDVWYPSLMLIAFLSALQLFVTALVLLTRRRDLRLVLCGLIPAALVFAYLGTVNQIMGFNSRYYVPYAPLLVVPAVLVLDRWLAFPPAESEAWPGHTLRNRAVVTAFLLLFFLLFYSQAVQRGFRLLEHGHHVEYDPVQLKIAADKPLPAFDWKTMMLDVTDDLIAPLPPGATVASSEVGYLGVRASGINIIDLAGLNDTEIALHGFEMSRLLERKPDLIWMPHVDYTFQRGVMFSDPALLAQYDVYAEAGNFGIAIRKDSPYHAAIERQFRIFWARVYPGYDPADYLVRSASWSGAAHSVRNR